MPSQQDTTPQAIALFDRRPFFEKALAHGKQHGIIPAQRLASMCQEAPKGMVQIARYFGTEYLRPDLELAKTRLVNLVSLYLEETCTGDLNLAAQALRDHSLLSRSKGGSDMLKALIAMPQNSHFGMQDGAGFRDEHIPLLAKWSLRSLADYQAEKARRSHVCDLVGAAAWMAGKLDLGPDELEEAGVDAEAVIRTALLAQLGRQRTLPDWPTFESWVLALRKKQLRPSAGDAHKIALNPPKDLPSQYQGVVESIRQGVVTDLAKMLDPALPVRRLFTQTPAFVGRYFWREDGLAEVDHFERRNSAAWDKATGGHLDDSSLLTLFLRIAACSSHATLLTKATAASLIRKIRKSGLDRELPRAFIRQHAPTALRDDYIRLWDSFAEDAEPALRSDLLHAGEDAMALLRRECNVTG
jgi:hypothetical protein